MNEKLLDIYRILFDHYGPREWWPAETPFEVVVGAILTQNTAWSNVEKAIERFRALIEEDKLGGEAQEGWILAHYRLGMLFEKKGDAAEAAKYYGKFIEIWKDADPDLAEVADARKRLAALTRY